MLIYFLTVLNCFQIGKVFIAKQKQPFIKLLLSAVATGLV